MPIKTFEFAFKLDAKDLLEYVVHRNIAVDIRATGSRRPEVTIMPSTQQPDQLPTPEQPLALSAPDHGVNPRLTAGKKGKGNSGLNSRGIVMLFLAQRREKVHSAELKKLLTTTGYAESSYASLIHGLCSLKWVRGDGKGHYNITAKGLQQLGGE